MAPFRGTIRAAEYRRILATLNAHGAQDVSEAVRLFNYYGETIGIKEFEGKEEKRVTAGGGVWEEGQAFRGLALRS